MLRRLVKSVTALFGCFGFCHLGFSMEIHDKTFVVWTAPSSLNQRGGSVLTLDDGQKNFDGIVFGEIEPKKWMPGSENYNRTSRDQKQWGSETSDGKEMIQIAIVYKGTEITLYRNGVLYSHYKHAQPAHTFTDHSTVLFGRRHLDAMDPENSFKGRISDARIFDIPLSPSDLQSLKPGKASKTLKPWAWWSFADQGLREMTGRFTEITLIGDVRLDKGALVLGGKGATVVSVARGVGDQLKVPASWSIDGAVPDEVVRSARQLREKFLADPYRPRYHFCVPEDQGMPGDPNGAFYYQGRYHLMYLYNRAGSGFCWGHVSSSDLVHWRHHPDAIGPGNGDEGCFSGGAYVDETGTAYLSYWMLWGAKGIGLASSKGPDFDHWTKLAANPVIRSTEWGVTEVKAKSGASSYLGSADPSNIWKDHGHYYMLTGNLLVLNKVGRSPDAPISEQGDRLYLFESDDLLTWRYKHVFYTRNPLWTDRSEDNMCPSFLPLPSSPDGGSPSGKHLLLFISHNKGCQYYIGSYSRDSFNPESHGRMTWIDNTYFAPEALVDGKGRQIMWAWLTDNPSGDRERGWSGVYGLPRSLWLGEDGTLRMQPVKELESLRGPTIEWTKPTFGQPLVGFDPTSYEIEAQIKVVSGARSGLKIYASKDAKEECALYYDSQTRELVFDSTRCGVDGRKVVERAPLELRQGDALKLRVFVDRSVVEVYANDRQAICRRVYVGDSKNLGVRLFSEGGEASILSLKAWTMNPSNPY